jgi:hypothetical protein
MTKKSIILHRIGYSEDKRESLNSLRICLAPSPAYH